MEAAFMSDKQFDKIIKMVRMIIDNCVDLDDAKRRLAELDEDYKPSKRTTKKTASKKKK